MGDRHGTKRMKKQQDPQEQLTGWSCSRVLAMNTIMIMIAIALANLTFLVLIFSSPIQEKKSQQSLRRFSKADSEKQDSVVSLPPLSTGNETNITSTTKNLLIFNALGKVHNLPLVVNTRRHVFKPDEWDCVAFMFAKEDRIPDGNKHLVTLRNELNCTVPRTPGLHWGDFLQFVTPTFVNNYEYVALVLDDIFFHVRGSGAVKPEKLIENMQAHNLDVIQPGIIGDSHSFIEKSAEADMKNCIIETNFIETYAQIFSSAAWECYYKMLDPSGSRGWCYDICLKHLCPYLRLGQDMSMKGLHMDRNIKELPPKDWLEGTTDLDEYKFEAPITTEGYLDSDAWAICNKYKCPARSKGNLELDYSMKKISCPI
mmetsp:Transcript_18480/g.26015  ORF Transcript_18480/g.26015 Transcript_18480/m.26015 type:complete len:371 (-) Transcript_18480:365-1477(-)